MEIIIPILTSLGAILGVSKNFFDLLNVSRNLKTTSRIDFFKKSKLLDKRSDINSLQDAYNVLDRGGEITTKILRRVRWQYILVFGICFVFFVVTSYSAVLIAGNLSIGSLIVFACMAFFITIVAFHFLLKNPIKFKAIKEHLDLQKIKQILEKANNIDYIMSEVSKTVNQIENSLTIIKERFGFNWLSSSEEDFIKEYNKVCAFVDAIETYLIRIRLKTVEENLYANLNAELKQVFIQTFKIMAERGILLRRNHDNEDDWKERQEKIIKSEFKKLGLEGMLQLVGKSFYTTDFVKLHSDPSGIEDLVTENFPFIK